MRAIPLASLSVLLTVPPLARAEPAAIAPEAPRSEARPLDGAWSLSVGTGFGGLFDFADGLAGVGPAGYVRTREDRLQVNVRIDRELGRRLRAGLAYTFVGWTTAYASGGGRAGAIDERAQVLMADATLRWVRTARVETYSALAAGYGRWRAAGSVAGVRYEDTQEGLAFQLRCFGVAAGSERLRAFAELGIGFEGLLVAGLVLRL